MSDGLDKFRQIADRKGEFTNDRTERLMVRLEKLPVDEQILEVRRSLVEEQNPGEILGSLAFTGWLHANKDRIVEMAKAGMFE